MLFAYDTEWGLRSAVELVNSAEPPDTLTTLEQLDEWYRRNEYSGRLDADAQELEALRALRPQLRELFTGGRDAAAERVNEMLARGAGAPAADPPRRARLAHPRDRPRRAARTAACYVETAMAMIDVIRADELSRLAVCADDGCEGLVLDLSRNRSRRFCSTRCANRNAVAAYRARGRGE